ELEEIVVVAADHARGGVAVDDAVTRNLRRRLRQEMLLDAPRQGQIMRFNQTLRRGLTRGNQPGDLSGDADEQLVVGRAPGMLDDGAFQVKSAQYFLV